MYVCRNEQEILYRTEISLEPSFDEKDVYEFEVKEVKEDPLKSANDFISRSDYYKNIKGMSLTKKVILTTLVYVYLTAVVVLIGLYGPEKGLVIMFGLAGLFTIVYAVVLSKIVKKDKQFRAIH